MPAKLYISEMYAFISVGDEGEGICAHLMGDVFMPLVGADMARVDSLRHAAKLIATVMGKHIKLVKFTNRVELEEIKPDVPQ